ncbi:hypothetical protein ACFPRL_22690 [Pseudoclavibacter helvolus]
MGRNYAPRGVHPDTRKPALGPDPSKRDTPNARGGGARFAVIGNRPYALLSVVKSATSTRPHRLAA